MPLVYLPDLDPVYVAASSLLGPSGWSALRWRPPRAAAPAALAAVAAPTAGLSPTSASLWEPATETPSPAATLWSPATCNVNPLILPVFAQAPKRPPDAWHSISLFR